jgi:hypothetical protein
MRRHHAADDTLVDAPPGPCFVTDIPSRTAGHIAYFTPLRSGDPIVRRGDTLAARRTWKNAFR